jgi:hypothetical protein
MLEQLEARQLFSAGIESAHGFVAPDGSPYLYGKYVLALQSAADDPRQVTETHVVTIKRHDGPSFGGWMWGGKRQQIKGSWNASDDSYHFEVLTFGSTGRMTNRGTMVMSWDPSAQTFTGHWAYHRGKQHFGLADFTLSKPPTA